MIMDLAGRHELAVCAFSCKILQIKYNIISEEPILTRWTIDI